MCKDKHHHSRIFVMMVKKLMHEWQNMLHVILGNKLQRSAIFKMFLPQKYLTIPILKKKRKKERKTVQGRWIRLCTRVIRCTCQTRRKFQYLCAHILYSVCKWEAVCFEGLRVMWAWPHLTFPYTELQEIKTSL